MTMDAKRLMDLAVGAAGLAATGPLVLLLAMAVKLDSPGPAFYVQTRVGRGRRPIRLLKLRTMRADPGGLGPQVTAARDPRVTRFGRLLRATKLDELPQLLNVVRGDMSLVGPRPEVERYITDRAEWDRVLSVRPGITDRASLVFRDEETLLAEAHDRERAYVEALLPVKLRLALQGVDHSSMADDLAVIACTALAVLGLLQPHAAIDEVRQRIASLNRESA